MKLGELLISAGKITPAQLEETLKGQAIFGGKLGTNLVEMGYLDEHDLAHFLSKKMGTPHAAPEQLMNIPPHVINLIPQDTVRKYRVVPIALNNRKLSLAMTDPSDFAAIDEISFRTGYIVVPLVTPELRLIGALEKYYNIKRELRYIPVAGGGRRGRVQTETPAPEPVPPPAARPATPPLAPRPAAKSPAPSQPREDVLELPVLTDFYFGDLEAPEPALTAPAAPGWTAAAASPPVAPILSAPISPASKGTAVPTAAAPPPPPTAPPTAPPAVVSIPEEMPPDYSLDGVLQGLAHGRDRDSIAELVVGYAAQTFNRSALFLLKGDKATGWVAHLWKKPLPGFENLELSLREPSVLKVVSDSKSYYVGPMPISQANSRIVSALGGGNPAHHLLVPLMMMGRVVAVLYLEGGPTDLDQWIVDLQKLLNKASMAFEILILKSKILLT